MIHGSSKDFRQRADYYSRICTNALKLKAGDKIVILEENGI